MHGADLPIHQVNEGPRPGAEPPPSQGVTRRNVISSRAPSPPSQGVTRRNVISSRAPSPPSQGVIRRRVKSSQAPSPPSARNVFQSQLRAQSPAPGTSSESRFPANSHAGSASQVDRGGSERAAEPGPSSPIELHDAIARMHEAGLVDTEGRLLPEIEKSMKDEVIRRIEKECAGRSPIWRRVLKLLKDHLKDHGLIIGQVGWTPWANNSIGGGATWNKIAAQLQIVPDFKLEGDKITGLANVTFFPLHDEAGSGGAIGRFVNAHLLAVDQLGFRFDVPFSCRKNNAAPGDGNADAEVQPGPEGLQNKRFLIETLGRIEGAVPYGKSGLQATLGTEAGVTMTWDMEKDRRWLLAGATHLGLGVLGSFASVGGLAWGWGWGSLLTPGGLLGRFAAVEVLRKSHLGALYLGAKRFPKQAQGIGMPLPDRIDRWNNVPTVGLTDYNGSFADGNVAATVYTRWNNGVGGSVFERGRPPARHVSEVLFPRQEAANAILAARQLNGDVEAQVSPAGTASMPSGDVQDSSPAAGNDASVERAPPGDSVAIVSEVPVHAGRHLAAARER